VQKALKSSAVVRYATTKNVKVQKYKIMVPYLLQILHSYLSLFKTDRLSDEKAYLLDRLE